MFKVQIFCKAPEHIELTDYLIKRLEWKKIIPNGIFERKFSSIDALYSYVRSFDYKEDKNHLLDAVMTHKNDSLRHRYTMEIRSFAGKKTTDEYYWLGYLITDEKGRTLDLRNYKKEIYTFDNKKYLAEKQALHREKWRKKYEIRDVLREKKLKLYEGKHYWSYYRAIRTTQELRWAANPENKGFVRGRRSRASLPNAYDDYYFKREKNWKARNKKAKRQWAVHFKTHTYILKSASRWNGEWLDESLYE